MTLAARQLNRYLMLQLHEAFAVGQMNNLRSYQLGYRSLLVPCYPHQHDTNKYSLASWAFITPPTRYCEYQAAFVNCIMPS